VEELSGVRVGMDDVEGGHLDFCVGEEHAGCDAEGGGAGAGEGDDVAVFLFDGKDEGGVLGGWLETGEPVGHEVAEPYG